MLFVCQSRFIYGCGHLCPTTAWSIWGIIFSMLCLQPQCKSLVPALRRPPYIYINFKVTESHVRAQEVCESRGGRPGHPVPVSPYGLCARKATLNSARVRAQEVCGGRGGRNGPYGLCGRKATLNSKESLAWNRMDLIRERSSAVCTCFAR